ncbi:hypothetical protein FSP39_015565 [Pinctada imbricata]|uniref:Zinc finger FYVE domain-containing protein 1 n=1 Tax=Pinctada imbricata TaxID=66713 RepID=A0AA88Y3M3_PINIB|nr:hypothetical protein FSP39_015565 [Pinctada imbricata]
MASPTKRVFRTKSSKRFCKEKFCCRSENTEARYHCFECGTDQCSDCDDSIHSTNIKYEFHDRRLIEPVPEEQLCQIHLTVLGVKCFEQNYADQRCIDCNLNFCYLCFDRFHKSTKKVHKKVSFKEFKQKELQKAWNDPIKPYSPIGIDDTSLTYVTLPQIGEELKRDTIESAGTDSMTSFSSAKSDHSHPSSIPDICLSVEKEIGEQTSLEARLAESFIEDNETNDLYSDVNSFMLLDDQETLKILDEDDFISKLGCGKDDLVKVVSIFGNTGDGKSYTLNYTFFGQKEVFKTSSCQSSCTIGVWAAFDPKEKVVTIDTEGLLGITTNQNQRMRLLLKVLAISDVIIYRTRAERLHTDMFQFLCDASAAYTKHFSEELEATAKRCGKTINDLTPSLLIFHETVNTQVLGGTQNGGKSAEQHIWDSFGKMQCTMHFKDLTYIGTQTTRPPTDFNQFKVAVSKQLADRSRRAARRPGVVYQTLRCCLLGGKVNIVIPKTSESKDNAWTGLIKYVWAGEVLECPNCGVIYRSRQNWYGNKEIEDVVSVEIRHVWPDGYQMLQGTSNAARKVIDGIHYITDSITSVGSKPTKMISDWMTDRIAPEYWVPNSQITHCDSCKVELETEQKHHCRACGKGFCDECSSKKRRVPERGWGDMVVRVCDRCFNGKSMTDSNKSDGGSQVTARCVGEVVSSAISVAASTFNYPIGMIKDTARPAYWIPDEQIRNCYVCDQVFGPKLRIHHCRACGNGVCEVCSPRKRPVPLRGWDYPVRVCTKCEHKKDRL